MNRRNFLTNFLKGTILAASAPQIISHGLGLKIRPKIYTLYPIDIDVKIVHSGQRKIFDCNYRFKLNEDIHNVHTEIPIKNFEQEYGNFDGFWVYNGGPKIVKGEIKIIKIESKTFVKEQLFS